MLSCRRGVTPVAAPEAKFGVQRSVQALERGVRAWLADENDQPRPFVRTKTADRILDKVAASCHPPNP